MVEKSTKFRTSSGKLRTRGLFIEVSPDPSNAMYSLGRADHPDGYPSLFLLYISEKDITEYRFAVKYFDSYAHWEAICEAPWFAPHIRAWRAELSALLKSEAFRRIVEAAESTRSESLRANEYILERKWEKAPKGRPSKEQVEKAATQIATEDARIKKDMERLDIPATPTYSDSPPSSSPQNDDFDPLEFE